MYTKTHIIFTDKKVNLKIGIAYDLLKNKFHQTDCEKQR